MITWKQPETDLPLLGYQINYGNSDRPPETVARESQPLNRPFIWLRQNVFFDFGVEVTFVVWAYSAHVKGEALRVTVNVMRSEWRVLSCPLS